MSYVVMFSPPHFHLAYTRKGSRKSSRLLPSRRRSASFISHCAAIVSREFSVTISVVNSVFKITRFTSLEYDCRRGKLKWQWSSFCEARKVSRDLVAVGHFSSNAKSIASIGTLFGWIRDLLYIWLFLNQCGISRYICIFCRNDKSSGTTDIRRTRRLG